jgi:amino acid transporter
MPTKLERAEEGVEQHSTALRKPLGLFDLVLTQILFVVRLELGRRRGKLGQAHLSLATAILLFYIPQAAVVIYLSNRMPLEGGIYQWAKLGFNEFAGFIVAWNLTRLLSITVIALGGMSLVTTNISYAIGRAPSDAREQMVRVADQCRAGNRPRAGLVSASCR